MSSLLLVSFFFAARAKSVAGGEGGTGTTVTTTGAGGAGGLDGQMQKEPLPSAQMELGGLYFRSVSLTSVTRLTVAGAVCFLHGQE